MGASARGADGRTGATTRGGVLRGRACAPGCRMWAPAGAATPVCTQVRMLARCPSLPCACNGACGALRMPWRPVRLRPRRRLRRKRQCRPTRALWAPPLVSACPCIKRCQHPACLQAGSSQLKFTQGSWEKGGPGGSVDSLEGGGLARPTAGAPASQQAGKNKGAPSKNVRSAGSGNGLANAGRKERESRGVGGSTAGAAEAHTQGGARHGGALRGGVHSRSE